MLMNREIKFRAKDKETNVWLTGSLLQDDYGNCCMVEFIDHHETWYDVQKETIGQFTGLYDRNQKPIYEGDIISSCEYEDIKHIVSYDDKVAAFIAVCIDEYTGTDLETKCNITKEWMDKYPKVVIGNVHDNKDLLNEE